MHRFKLIKPISSDKIYITTSLKHGANKCLNELNRKNCCCDEFTMINIDTSILYKFVVNKYAVHINKNITNNIDDNVVDELRERVKYLESQVSLLHSNESDEIISLKNKK
jgi:hypothetical protein